MNQSYNISLGFTADTKQAIADIKSLRLELNNLATGKNLKNNGFMQITPEIQKAMVAAGELQAKLEQATNIKTGKLDLGLFQESLKRSGTTLQEYAQKLSALGSDGQQAFNNLAKSVIQAETPIIRCNNIVKELGVSLKNTAKWQISSSILHGFMGAIQSAYGYAQDLNESLNNIRIVTGQNIDQMSKFAEQANKAAKALSTTTTEYTNASLIYYQQGLSDSEVQKRTDVTVKMANVAGQSAEVVSDQLTSIWNNFYDGSKSLEYYADVMTALGAATASSTDEIAGGLEKFAAVGETIGLSYEYAAAALATITSNTRESEEVVGTALKTIFARIQGLELGETLEDGVNLNKYSEALEAVGISIFDQKGELKDMDDILNEMADTWDTLSNKQQVALAQTVAGVRQYNQLMALMKYWDNDDVDSMTANLKTIQNSDGALQEQADIYAEGWEAARDRVTASAEAIYTKILNDEFFISMLDTIAKALDGIGSLIDAFGGIKGVLFTVGAMATNLFNKEIAQGARNAYMTMKQLFPGVGKRENEKTKIDAIEAMASMRSSNSGHKGEAENVAIQREAEMQKQLMAVEKNLSAEELKQLQIQMDLVRAMDQRTIAAAKALDVAENELKVLQDQNRIRTKMDAETKAKETGKVAAGEDLIEQATRKKGNSVFKDEKTTELILQKYQEAEQKVRSDHNFGVDKDSLRGYEAEINKEFIDLMIKAIKDTNFNIDGDDVEQINNIIATKITSAIQTAKVEDVGNEVDKVQKQVQAAGALNAQGKALQRVGSDLKTKDSNEEVKKAEELSKIYQQVKTRITETTKAANELEKELEETGDSNEELKKLITTLGKLEKELEESKGDADALQAVLDKIAAVNDGDEINVDSTDGIGETVKGFSMNINQDIQDGAGENFSEPSFNLQGQFESSSAATEKRIIEENATSDASDANNKLNESFQGSKINDWADNIANATSIVMSLGSVITSVQGAIDVFNNPDASAWDKVSAVISVVIGALPVLSSLTTAFGSSAAAAGTAAATGFSLGLGPILAIIAAIAAVTAAIVLLSDHFHDISAEGQLEKAQKAAEELKNELEETKQRADDLKSSFDRYNNVSDKLKDCTKGTEEWNAALQEVNSEVIDLLQKYPELSTMTNDFGESAIFRDPETGALQIQDWAIEQLTIQVENAIINTQTASIMTQQTVNEKKVQVAAGELKDIIFDFNTVVDPDLGRKNETGEVEEAADLFYKYLIENIEKFYQKTDEELFQAVTDWIKTDNIKDTILDQDVGAEYIRSLVNLIKQYSGIISNYKETLDNSDKSNQLSNKTIATNALSGEERVQKSKYRDEITLIVEEAIVDQEIEKKKEEMNQGVWNPDNITRSTTKDDNNAITIFDQYAKAQGWSEGSYQLTDVTGKGNEAQFEYKLGNVQQDPVSLEVMRAVVAATSVNEQVAENANQLVTVLGKKTEEEVAAITSAITGDSGNVKVGAAQEENISDWAKTQADNMSEDDLKALGYDGNVDEMRKAYAEALEEVTLAAAESLEDIKDNYTNAVSGKLDDLQSSLTNLDLSQFEQVGDILQTALREGGKDSFETMSSVFGKIGSDGAKKLLEGFNDINWSNITIEELKNKLNSLGIATGTLTDTELANMIDVMGELGNAADEAENSIVGLIDHLKGIKEGSIISKDEYDKYYKDKGLDDFFLVMEDGSRKLIGDAAEFYNLVYGMTIDEKQNTIDDLEDSKNSLSTDQTELKYLSTLGYTLRKDGTIGNEYKVSQQLDFIEQMNLDTGDLDIEELRNIIADDKQDLTTEQAKQVAQIIQDFITANGGLAGAQDVVNTELQNIDESISTEKEKMASLATSIDELNNMFTQSDADAAAYGEGLLSLASNYVECTDEANEYQKVLKNHKPESDEARAAAKKLQKAITTAEFKKAATAVKNYTTELKKLKKEGADSKEIAETQQELADALNEAFGTNIDGTWVEENQDLLDEWVNSTGDAAVAAGMKVKTALALASADFKQIEIDLDLQTGTLESEVQTLMNYFAANPLEWDLFCQGKADLSNLLEALGGGEKAARILAGLLKAIGQSSVEFSGSAEEMEAALKELELADGEKELVTTTTNADGTVTATVDTSNLQVLAKALAAFGNSDIDFGIDAGSVPDVDGVDMTDLGSGSGGGGGGGGSESSPAKPMKKTKRSDMGERYEQIDNKLDNLADTMTKVQNISDTLWGKSHIENLKQQNKLLDEEVKLLEKKYQEAKDYAASDLNDLKSAAANLGVSLQIDSKTGDIVNIEEVYDQIYSKLSQAEDRYNSMSTADQQSQFQESTLDPLNEDIDLFEEYYSLYKEALETAEDIEIEMQEKLLEIQANNFAIWQEELEIHIELNEDDMKLIEHMLSRMEDDFYSMAEAASLMANDQLSNYTDTMKAYEDSLADLEEKYKNNEITMADYVEGLNTINEGLLDTAGSMVELDKTMKEYYEETLSAANDEISKYTDAMDHQSSVLEHYVNILELAGKSKDYKRMGLLLDAQVKTAENATKVAKDKMNWLKGEADEAHAKYMQALQEGNAAAAEIFESEYEAALAAANEAEEEYLSRAEEQIEKIKSRLEGTLADLANTLENALTGNLSLDQIASQMEKASSLQEEYLTTTNKIYETEKMMLAAQQEIDKTTNTVAKQKLKNFINETKELQNQTKLSQYELDIQQAEYDLLLAKIALEEAQNAKSTVRLQRDSQGNFGYVYTADSEKIANAEQQVLDAEQKLYQIGLDGINDYMNKYQQTVQEMYDELTELSEKYKEGEFESEEEYRQSVLEVQEYYFQKLKDYEDLYHISSEVDTRAYVDSQAILFEENLFNTEAYIEAARTYGEQALEELRKTSEEISKIETEVLGDSLEELEDNTNEVLDKNKEMADHITEELIPAIEDEVDKVKIATQHWAEHRGELEKVISVAEQLSSRINQLKVELAQLAQIANTVDGLEGVIENYEVPETDLPDNYSPSKDNYPKGNYTPGGNDPPGGNYTPGGNDPPTTTKSFYSSSSASNNFLDWISSGVHALVKSVTGQYDTGGYTGEWGSYGKLAILHEKELVLNKMQTSKFAGLMSSMQEYLDLQSKLAQTSNIQDYLYATRAINEKAYQIEQNVHIEATFPDVNSHSEIELAFDNLINKASQYAYRNN